MPRHPQPRARDEPIAAPIARAPSKRVRVKLQKVKVGPSARPSAAGAALALQGPPREKLEDDSKSLPSSPAPPCAVRMGKHRPTFQVGGSNNCEARNCACEARGTAAGALPGNGFEVSPCTFPSQASPDGDWDSDDVDWHKSVLVPALQREEVGDGNNCLNPSRLRNAQVSDIADCRAEVVAWIVRVHDSYRLGLFSLFLAIRVLDTLDGRHLWGRQKLLGAAALLVASKFEEETSPDIASLAAEGQGSYSEAEIRVAELLLLTKLGFRLHMPTAAHHLAWFQLLGRGGTLQRELSQYVCELGLTSRGAARWAPVQHSAASALLAAAMLRRPATAVLESICEFFGGQAGSLPATLATILIALRHAVEAATPRCPVWRKYATKDHNFVALRAADLMKTLRETDSMEIWRVLAQPHSDQLA